jgi:hypothetical protein
MKIWVDDLRPPPDDSWTWYKTSTEVIEDFANLSNNWHRISDVVSVMSLDHDLGDEDTTRGIVLWCCHKKDWPKEVRVHSANPVGIEWLEGMIERYKT